MDHRKTRFAAWKRSKREAALRVFDWLSTRRRFTHVPDLGRASRGTIRPTPRAPRRVGRKISPAHAPQRPWPPRRPARPQAAHVKKACLILRQRIANDPTNLMEVTRFDFRVRISNVCDGPQAWLAAHRPTAAMSAQGRSSPTISKHWCVAGTEFPRIFEGQDQRRNWTWPHDVEFSTFRPPAITHPSP